MALTRGSIPNFFNGVSQQPAPLRHTSQCAASVNAYPSIATGLRKRPPTEHLTRLTTTETEDACVHLINRDANERYIVILLDGAIEVYNALTGAACSVSTPNGVGYLNVGTAREDFSIMTVADYSFIVNKTITVAMSGAVTGAASSGAKQKFSDLPAPTASGNVWRVAGDPSNNFDDYYVLDSGGPVWVETAGPSQQNSFDPATMPHKLVRTGANAFTFSQQTWDARLVGDTVSNPTPDFVGRKLKDIFFFRNRLGVVADEAFNMSRSGNYWNFWAKSVTAVLDDDPIEAAVSHTKVSILEHAVPFNKVLMGISANAQFQLSGEGVLTPRTVQSDLVTEYESSTLAKPVGSGSDLFFATNRGAYTGLLEYFVEKDSVSNETSNTTAHCPNYVPMNVFKIAPCTADDVLFLLTLEERNAIYVYKYYWAKDEKVQSAWQKFTFDEGDTVLDVSFVNQAAYVTVRRADGCYLEVLDLQANLADAGFDYFVLLDRRCEATGVYSAGDDWTTWTLPYPDSGDIKVILGSGFGTSAGTVLGNTTRPSTTTIRALGDHSGFPAFLGRTYEERHQLSEIHMKDSKEVAVESGRLQLGHLFVTYADSGYFRIEVTPSGQSTTYAYPMSGQRVGSTILGAMSLGSGTFAVPIGGENRGTIIEIVNDTHLPSTIHSAEWDGEFTIASAGR